jgi:hypothetical protein
MFQCAWVSSTHRLRLLCFFSLRSLLPSRCFDFLCRLCSCSCAATVTTYQEIGSAATVRPLKQPTPSAQSMVRRRILC